MKARYLTLAALAALVTACGGGEEQTQAGDSATPGATGTSENTGPETAGSTPVDTLTASDATTAGANGSAGAAPGTTTATTPPNAPPATATPATMGDTTAATDSAHGGH